MILMIHNPLRTDRKEILTRELVAQGLHNKISLVSAVTETRNPVVNISRAHKKCVQAAKDAGENRVIIMEDDVKFMCPGSFTRFLELSQQLPEDWDIFLSGVYDAVIDPYSADISKVRKFSGLHCYMVNARYYDTFLKAPENINLDKALSTEKYGSSNAYLAYPILAMQHDGFSDNVRRETNYNQQALKRYKFWDCTNK